MPGFLRAVSLASSAQHALSSFGPPGLRDCHTRAFITAFATRAGFLAKFVALLCSAPAQLSFAASVKNRDTIGLDTLREVVVAILGAEKRQLLRCANDECSSPCRPRGAV